MKRFLILVFLFSTGSIIAQQQFTLRIDTAAITSAPALHSGAFGTYDNKWFFIGGRINGLHGFQPAAAFPVNKANKFIYIVDPTVDSSWNVSTAALPHLIREAVTSTNMEFYLSDSTLYMVGGYGWDDTAINFITFPTLTAVNIKGLMNAIMNAQPIAPYFRQIIDTNILPVCGAHLQKLDSTYYLVFGQKFGGHYDVSDSLGFFVQHYNREIRKFQIADDGTNLSIYNYNTVYDSVNFRRRDYNLVPQLYPDGSVGLTGFSGVFQEHRNLPYLNCVEIKDTTYSVRNDFNQYLSQYHSAVCSIYDSAFDFQHNIFFGGISEYYIDTTTTLQIMDTLVPFVKTISDVVRDNVDTFREYNMNIRMPALLGTNAYFFPDLNAPMLKNRFIHLNQLASHQRIGFIIGGIESPDLNISTTDPTVSTANNIVYEIYLDRTDTVSGFTEVTNDVFNFFVYPNPAGEKAEIEFELLKTQNVKIEIADMQGRLVKNVCNKFFDSGKHTVLLNTAPHAKGIYHCSIVVNNHRKSIRLVKD